VTFTPRQRQIARLVAHGYADKDVAARLGISVGTVRTHLYRMYDSYHLRGRVDLIRLWIRTPGAGRRTSR
jgi:DNA-binding CsgD family transcriptional regulator